jgi:hypothetical protein
VFVETFDEPQRIEYTFPKKVSICTRYVVTVYDFDRASSPEMKNTGLVTYQFCQRYGECNKFVPKFDWYTVLTHLISLADENPKLKSGRDELKMVLGRLYDPRPKLRIGADGLFGLPCTCQKIDKKQDICVQCTAKSLRNLTTPRTYFLKNVHLLEGTSTCRRRPSL